MAALRKFIGLPNWTEDSFAQNGGVCEIPMTGTLLDSFKAGHAGSPATDWSALRGQSPVSPIWACARNARTTFCDKKAEIGEPVDPVIHIERRSGRLILPEVLGIVDTRPTRKAL